MVAKNEILSRPPGWKGGFIETLCGVLYHMRWEDKHDQLPQPGAQAWAYETYQLPAFTPIGPGTHAWRKRPHAFYGPPAYTYPATVIAGIPRIAGQYILQPLVNPYPPTNPYGPQPNP